MQVKRTENEILFHLSHVVEPLFGGLLYPKNAIGHLQVILEYADLDASDAKVFREAISKLEGVISTIDAVKEELGRTELSKRPLGPSDIDDIPDFPDHIPDEFGDAFGALEDRAAQLEARLARVARVAGVARLVLETEDDMEDDTKGKLQ